MQRSKRADAVKEKELIECWFDGCCEPVNPGGHAGYGAVAFQDGKRIWEFSGYIPASPRTSNNVGEYTAFLTLLKWLRSAGLNNNEILIHGDSKLVIEQMFGSWRMHQGFYVQTARRAQRLLHDFPRIYGEWIPREKNSLADELSKAELIKRNVKFRIQPI